MPGFILEGYKNSIYSPMGLKEFITKEYNIFANVESILSKLTKKFTKKEKGEGKKDIKNKDYKKIHDQILKDVSSFEQKVNNITSTLKTDLAKGENCRYSWQFIYITDRDSSTKHVSDFEKKLTELSEATNSVIETLCNCSSKIKNKEVKKAYSGLIAPIKTFHEDNPPRKIASDLIADYLAVEDTKNLKHHFLRGESRGLDIKLGNTLLDGKEIKLPTDKNVKLTHNNALAMEKNGEFYYVKFDGKLWRYNNKGENTGGNIQQGSFGKSINEIKNRLKEVWE